MFQNQQERTTLNNLNNDISPAMESMYMCAQPKIYLLLQLVEFSDNVSGGVRGFIGDQNSVCIYENSVKEETVKACQLVSSLEDKAIIAHIYHYYSLKVGEVWMENDMLSRSPDDMSSPVESQSIDIMMVRHVHLMSLIKMIQNQVATLEEGDLVSYNITSHMWIFRILGRYLSIEPNFFQNKVSLTFISLIHP